MYHSNILVFSEYFAVLIGVLLCPFWLNEKDDNASQPYTVVSLAHSGPSDLNSEVAYTCLVGEDPTRHSAKWSPNLLRLPLPIVYFSLFLPSP